MMKISKSNQPDAWDIAKLTVTSRQKSTTMLSELKKQNIIMYDRKKLIIKQYEKLS
ncbi:winged helix-turn-helix domain-containing protein [bacterium]|nr:winged helix-turn-helix domain-containing protein [bacterium]